MSRPDPWAPPPETSNAGETTKREPGCLAYALTAAFLLGGYSAWQGHTTRPLLALALTAAGLFVAYLGAMLYVVAPARIYRRFRQPTEPRVGPIDPDDPHLPPEVAPAIREAVAALGPEGFAARGHLRVAGGMPGTVGFLTLLKDRKSAVVARQVTTIGHRGRFRKAAGLLAFTTKFADGTEITTSNARQVSPFAPVPGRTVLAFPGVRDPARLLRIHREAVARLGAFSTPRPEPIGDPLAYVADGIIREMEAQVRAGYLAPDEAGRAYRATRRGALLMALRQLWPWAHLRHARMRRQAARLLREAGLSGLNSRRP